MSDHTHRTAGVPVGAYSDFRPGQRVMTVDGFPGRVVEVLEGPHSNRIEVVLDNGMGGGTYDDSMLTPLNERSSAVAPRTADQDYPELGTILTDRPDLEPVITEGEYLSGRRRTASLAKTADFYLDTPESLALSEAAASLLGASNRAMHRVVSDSEVVPEHLAGAVVAAAMVHCETCGVDYAVDSEDEKHDHSKTADWHLNLPPKDDASPAQSDQPGYDDGLAQAKAGRAREPKSPGDPAYMAGFSLGWAHGVENRPSNPEIPLTDPSDLVDDTLDPDKVASKQAGIVDFLRGSDKPSKTWEGPGHNYSFDACRFRKNSRCMYPKELNKAATDLAGYAVWIPEDRGYCPRVSWDDQKACPLYEPGPNVPGGYTDATVAWEDGGQRGGTPREPYRQGAKTAAADTDGFSFHFTAAWSDVRKKAKRIRQNGGVRVLSSMSGDMVAQVRGDHHVYQTRVSSVPDRYAVGSWECGCPWAAYSWGRTGPWKKYEGRMCSHALATVYEAQSRGMFGKTITEDEVAPAWLPKGTDVKVPGDYDRDLGAYTSAKAEDSWELAALLVASGRPIAEIHPTVMAMAFDGGHAIASKGPLTGQVGGRVRDLIFEEGEVVDAATGTKIPGPVYYPTYDPTAGLNFRSATKEGSMGAEHWAMTFDASEETTPPTRDEPPVRYLILNAEGDVVYRIRSGEYFGRWDFTLPGPVQGGRAVDLFAKKALLGDSLWATSDLHEEPEPALPTTDGADEDATMEQARQALLAHAAIASEICPHCGLAVGTMRPDDRCPQCGGYFPEPGEDDPPAHEAKAAPAKDPHAWLLEGSAKDGDVAQMAQAFLANRKEALKDFSAAERKSIIDEGEGTEAGNLAGLDITGTHYVALEQQTRSSSLPGDSLL